MVDSVKEKTVINILTSENNANNGEYAQVVALANKMAERIPILRFSSRTWTRTRPLSPSMTTRIFLPTTWWLRVKSATVLLQRTICSPSEVDQSTYQQVYYQDVDSQLASAVSAVNAESLPVRLFDTAHNESGAAGYRSLLESNNFEVVEFNLLTEEIPETHSTLC